MFFSNSCKSKNGENGLVLVFFLKLLVLTCFFLNSWNPKKRWTFTSFGIDMFFSQTFGVGMFFSNSCKSKNGENWLVLVLTDWNLEPWGKLPSFGVDMFFSNLNPKYVENWLALVLTCFFLNSWNQKKWWKLTSFGVDMFFSNSWNPKNGENWLVLVLFGLKLRTMGKID